ncbi:hypothetical protein SAMN04488543_3414 [Friedmanniella luteola]|uniref:Uncharacterized protein n=1 Tax=Friedmanniella luteola TaxID=546871 RepID=A0A1H1YRM0_9ACTN|nr:hypothetical protein [Friedmanniella luteola]SDT24074.1 hypothetical protein SAMN04488543_3414 [Friedmanniella luteola]
MVDPDPGYRPRRAADGSTSGADRPAAASAAGTPGPTSPEPATAAGPAPVGSAPAAGSDPAAGRPGSDAPATTPGPAAAAAPATDDEDRPKPLYRDEPAVSAPAGSTPLTGEETRITRPVFKPRARRTPDDEDSTTLLPRTPAGRRPEGEREERLDDDHPRTLLGRRGRLALLIGALAAVIAVGLAVMYAVSTVGDRTADPGPATPVPSTAPSGSAAPTAADPGAVLADAALLDPASAAQIAPGTWTVALTQRPPADDAPVAACFSDEPAEGQPTGQQEVVRLLSGSGKQAPSALHRAAAYNSPEEAAQAYAVAAKTLGGCVSPGTYIADGSTVTGLGDQSTGIVANVITAGKTQWHSIVLSRSGRVVNLVDAARAGKPLGVRDVAAALGAVTGKQCQAAGQPCTTKPVVKFGPPPLGGDVPGFLATGDLPPAGEDDESWVATPAEPPSEEFLGSQCETVTWARLDAETASSRVYLVPSSTTFGLNEIVLTMKSDKAAGDLVAKIKSDLESCEKRKLTASVSDPAEVTGVGASAAEVTGWTAAVSQKSTQGTQRYRVGIVSSGSKVAYTFLNPLDDGYDLTDDEWDMVAVRAGQRMTQVP